MTNKFENTWSAWKWRLLGATVGLIMAAPLFIMSAKAETQSATIWHIEKATINSYEYRNEKRCFLKKVPIYGEHYYQHGQGSSNGDLLGAMILGGIFGHALSGNNDGAAAGAVLGALVQNEKGNQTSTGRHITGYETREMCDVVKIKVPVTGNRNVVHWKWNNHRGHFFSQKEWYVGQRVWVDVN